MEAEDCSNSPVLLKEESVTQSRKQLIEEISSPEVREKPTVPVHEIITVRDAEEKPLQIQLTIHLPEVGSVSECDLSISKVRERNPHVLSACYPLHRQAPHSLFLL